VKRNFSKIRKHGLIPKNLVEFSTSEVAKNITAANFSDSMKINGNKEFTFCHQLFSLICNFFLKVCC